MKEISEEAKARFFEEVGICLKRGGFQTGPVEDGFMPVFWQEAPLCRVNGVGGVRYRSEVTRDPGSEAALNRAMDIVDVTEEYMRLLEKAPQLSATGLDESYKCLNEFNSAVLAAHHTPRHGWDFVTWCRDYSGEGVTQGHYVGGDYEGAKVRSAVFTVEEREGQLWGVAECKVAGELTPEELSTLKEFISGQASDGVGEGFEQRDLKVSDGVLNVHLWNSENWSIQTEQERFAPKLAEGLPEMCFSVLPGHGDLICIKRGESGYYPSDWSTNDRQRNEALADHLNERLGVTPAQRQAMETGSMHGWTVPGADPKAWEQKAPQMGGMSFG